LFEAEGLPSLLSAIRIGADRLKTPFKVETPAGDLTILTKTIRETKGTAPKYTIEVDYPLLEGADEEGAKEINVSLQGFVLNRIHRFRGSAFSGSAESRIAYENILDVDYDVLLLTSQFLSLRFSIYDYYGGAAHGMTRTRTFNYQLQPPRFIELCALFKTDMDYLEIVSAYCVNDLIKQAVMKGDEPDNLFLDGALPKEENFRAFNITAHSLIITFEPYQVDCYAAGTKHVEIPYTVIRDHLNHDGILHPLLDSIDV
jgi:hypothetical protein